MKILYYDCFSGISGDMNLGAMVDLGVDPAYLINELEKLNLDGYSLSFVPDQRKGISGTRAIVTLTNERHSHSHTPSAVSNSAQFKPGGNQFQISHGQEHNHEHARNFADIKKLIHNSSLSEKVKTISVDMFTRVAVAEAKIHGKSIDQVHFHEVGAVDSIVDIIGAAICIDFLQPDKIQCSTIELGGGMVKCAHGNFPVPAPATAEILKNIPVKTGAVNVETTTPTGAAILASLTSEFTDKINLAITKIGYGIGYRDTSIPNVLRVYLGEISESATDDFIIGTADVIECNIDDMNPEVYEHIMNCLFEAGADDIYFQPIIMKKTRPATMLSVICAKEVSSAIEDIILRETSSLGVRKYEVSKKMLKRKWETISTQWGNIRLKHAIYKGEILKSKPEYEDCHAIAKQYNVPISVVYKEIERLTNTKDNGTNERKI